MNVKNTKYLVWLTCLKPLESPLVIIKLTNTYVQLNYLCYLITQVSWFQAYVNCGLYGYKLATIESKEENENIVRQLRVQGNAG